MAESNEIRLMGGKLIVAGVSGYTVEDAAELRRKMQDKLNQFAHAARPGGDQEQG